MVYFWQKSCPQFLQWWRRSVREKRTVQPEQLSTTSSFTQWSAAERPGWSLTDQLKTRPRPSPTRILLWSLWWHGKEAENGREEAFSLRSGRRIFPYLEIARDVISAGWALSLRSNAVCMVSLLLKTSWRSHLYPVDIRNYTLTQPASGFTVKTSSAGRPQPTCSELVVGACVCGGGLERLWRWALARIRWMRVRDFSLAFRVVDKHKAVLLVDAERVWPAVRVVRAAVHRPGGTCSGWRPWNRW